MTLGGRCKKPADRYLFLPGSIHRPTVHLTCEHKPTVHLISEHQSTVHLISEHQSTVHISLSTSPLCNLHLNILNNRPDNTLKPTHIQYLCMKFYYEHLDTLAHYYGISHITIFWWDPRSGKFISPQPHFMPERRPESTETVHCTLTRNSAV